MPGRGRVAVGGSAPTGPMAPRHVRGTVPYPWPYDGDLDPARLALIVAGCQPAWQDCSIGIAAVTANIGRLAARCRDLEAAVVLLRHQTAPLRRRASLPPRFGDRGWKLAMQPGDGDAILDAYGIDGFHESELDGLLRGRGIDQLCFTGFGAELAVDSSLRSANDRGYECLVLSDAVAPLDPATGSRTLASMTMSGGIFGAVGDTEELLVALEPFSISDPRSPS